MLRNGMDDVWKHPFFKGLSMESIEQKSRASPYCPVISDGVVLAIESDIDPDDLPTPRKYTGKFDFSCF